MEFQVPDNRNKTSVLFYDVLNPEQCLTFLQSHLSILLFRTVFALHKIPNYCVKSEMQRNWFRAPYNCSPAHYDCCGAPYNNEWHFHNHILLKHNKFDSAQLILLFERPRPPSWREKGNKHVSEHEED